MGDIIAVGGDLALISFFDTRAQEIAAAQQQTSANTLAVANAAKASASQGYAGNATSRTITLELTSNGPPINSNGQAAQTPNASGLATIANVSAKRTTVSTITFDIGLGASGYAQTIEITQNARQGYHQTAVGFYLDEFNEGVGSLSVDAEIVYGTNPAQQIQAFFDLLHNAKITEPLANEQPLRLRYFDSYLQRSLEITQDNIRLRTEADKPGKARLMIAATILYDYSIVSSNVTSSQVSLATPPASASLLASALTAFT